MHVFRGFLHSSLNDWRVVSGLVFVVAVQSSLTASAQTVVTASAQQSTVPIAPTAPDPPTNATPSDYSLGTTSLAIPYVTDPTNTGGSTIGNGQSPKDQKFSINWQTSSGVPPAEGILVTFKVSYMGAPYSIQITNAVLRKDTSYSLDSTQLSELSTDLITWIKTKLPRDFNPNTRIILDGPVEVDVTPILPADTPPSATPPPPSTAYINATGIRFSGIVNQLLSNVTVANFTNANPNATAANTTAMINWGDGLTTAGSVASLNGAYAVTGTHTYLTAGTNGSFPVSVTITDSSGQAASTQSTATIVSASKIVATGVSFPVTPGVALPAGTVVAGFIDTFPSVANQSPTAQIAWGDGRTSVGTVNGGPTNYTVIGTHTYATPGANGDYAVTVTITDPGGAQSAVVSTATNAAPNAPSLKGSSSKGNSPKDAAVYPNLGTPTRTTNDLTITLTPQ
jgi:hypothetical protein